MTGWLRALDLRPLRSSRAFGHLWSSSLLTGMGSQIAAIAVLAQTWDLTRSPVWTGAIGLVQGAVMLSVGTLGGSLADRYDRRSLLLVAGCIQFLAAVALASQAALQNTSVILLFVLLAVASAGANLAAPARRALPARLLPTDQVTAGLALTNLAFQVTMLIGPSIGGFLIAHSFTLAYAMQAAMLPIALLAVLRLPPLRHSAGDDAIPTSRRANGWLLPLRLPVLRGAFLTDLVTTTLTMPIAIFPLINAERFDDDPRTLGLFLTAIALGGIVAGLLSGTVTRLRRSGLVQFVAAAGWCLCLIGFGTFDSPASIVLLVIAGACDTVGVVTRSGLVQLVTPDHSRGRVSAIDHVIGAAGPELGNMRGGALAGAIGGPAALVVGGLSAVTALAAIGLTHPDLPRWRRP